MRARVRLLLTCLPLGLLAGCLGSADGAGSASEALEAVECDPVRGTACRRGQVCAQVRAADGDTLHLCATEEECVSRDDCREGYECAERRCLATREPEREPERDLCREGSVPGIPLCADGFVAQPLDRHCWQCVPTRDPDRERDPAVARPEAERRIVAERPGDHERRRRLLAEAARLRRLHREAARRRAAFADQVRRPGDRDLRDRTRRPIGEPVRRAEDDAERR